MRVRARRARPPTRTRARSSSRLASTPGLIVALAAAQIVRRTRPPPATPPRDCGRCAVRSSSETRPVAAQRPRHGRSRLAVCALAGARWSRSRCHSRTRSLPGMMLIALTARSSAAARRGTPRRRAAACGCRSRSPAGARTRHRPCRDRRAHCPSPSLATIRLSGSCVSLPGIDAVGDLGEIDSPCHRPRRGRCGRSRLRTAPRRNWRSTDIRSPCVAAAAALGGGLLGAGVLSLPRTAWPRSPAPPRRMRPQRRGIAGAFGRRHDPQIVEARPLDAPRRRRTAPGR